ncbi:beta-1,4-glucuronyltransferase 1 isoform X2 [Palaemon carinicauda]|uniref:beta-1,4-glucuronyltransferase 1 isoform X2 n=1 Tax=Palaemon carinicauda TaxID=392227 RepID=UPI0035B69409
MGSNSTNTMICKVWGVGMFSIVALTTSNILLTLRLMHGRDDGFLGGGGGCGGSIPDTAPHSWTAALSSTNHSEYLTFLKAAAINTGAQAPPENEVVLNDDKGLPDSSETPLAGFSGPSLLLGTGFRVDESTGRWDVRRRYKIHDHVFTGPQYPRLTRESPVCLATQTSVDRLFWLTQVARYWTSPMSVAVFTPDVEYAIARAYLTYLVTCFPFLGEKVTFHFTYPRDHLPRDIPLVIDHLEGKCDQPLAVLKELLKQRNSKMLMWRERMPYPQNVVRNVARKNCGTEWVFLADVDIVPIPGLSDGLATFLATKPATQCKKCAFVVPTYEVDERSPLPYNRSSLLRLAEQGRARPFHQKVFVHNQHATNFSRWEAREHDFPGEVAVSISHPVTNFEFFYEPFYVARDDVPPHDERFLGYGFTRNTQVYEMFVSGYSFHVLSPIFTLHWGMQVKRSRPAWREKQNNANRRLFEGFKREVFARYGKDPLNMMATKKPRKS